jgi:hypothetical protein
MQCLTFAKRKPINPTRLFRGHMWGSRNMKWQFIFPVITKNLRTCINSFKWLQILYSKKQDINLELLNWNQHLETHLLYVQFYKYSKISWISNITLSIRRVWNACRVGMFDLYCKTLWVDYSIFVHFVSITSVGQILCLSLFCCHV